MGGFFGLNDYNKPGPGVPENAQPKPGIIVFFEVLSRKYTKLIKLNLMFLVFNLPAIILSFFLMLYLFGLFFPNGMAAGLKNVSDDTARLFETLVAFAVSMVFVCIPIITVGPAQCGFTYILRNFSREEHAFLWSDFKEHALKNFKQSIAISIIDIIVFVVVMLDFYLYRYLNNGSIIITITSVLLFVAFIIYMIMHIYIYPMLVTFELGIRQIYKNALIFTFAKFLPNLIILILCVVIIFGCFIVSLMIQPLIGIAMLFLFLMSFIGYITNFYAYGKIKRYMLDKIEGVTENAAK